MLVVGRWGGGGRHGRRYARALQEVRVGRLATLRGHRTRSGRAAAGAAGGGRTRCGRGVLRRAHGERLQQQVVARRGVHACNEGDKRTAITERKLYKSGARWVRGVRKIVGRTQTSAIAALSAGSC